MPPAATLDSRAPSTFPFDSPNPNTNPSDFAAFNTGYASRLGSTTRSKPRLLKHRKKPPSTATSADHGINPFQSVSPQSSSNGQFDSLGFVFGGSNSNEVNGKTKPVAVDNAGFEGVRVGIHSGKHDTLNRDVFKFGDGVQEPAVFSFGAKVNPVTVDNGGKIDTLNRDEFKFGDGIREPRFNEMPAVFSFGAAGKDRNDSGSVQDANIGSSLNGVNAKVYPVSVDNGGFEGAKLGDVGSKCASTSIDPGKSDALNRDEFKFGDGVREPRFGEMPAVFSFGAAGKYRNDSESVRAAKIGSEFELSAEMKKLNIENVKKGDTSVDLNNTDGLRDKDDFFVFQSGAKSADVSTQNSVPLKSEVNVGNSDEPKVVNENIFVFRSSGSSKTADFSDFESLFSAFPVGADEVKVKENENHSSFSSSLGVESVCGEPEACSSAEGRKFEFEFGTSSSSTDFKLPGLDPSLLSASLASGLGSKLEPGPRTRVPKDRHLRRRKQTKPKKSHPIQKPLPNESMSPTAQDQEAAECYSPMDFSPYEESTSNNDVPRGGHDPTDQANLQNCSSSTAFTKDGLGSVLADSNAGISSNTSGPDGGGSQVCFSSNDDSGIQQKFEFNVSSPAQEHVLSKRRQQRKKYRLRTEARGSTARGSKPPLSRLGQAGAFTTSESMGKCANEGNEEQEEGESALSAAEKACDKWRRRGNEAYEKGELSKAEDFYTWGINCVPPDDTSSVAFRPLVQCYSNRAATRMTLGRVREAIQDCLMAVKLDPTFLKAHIRAANCHLLLGELEDAIHGYEKSMNSSNVVCLDRQLVISASDGIQKSQKVIECMNRSAELLKLGTSEAATSAMESISEAMSISKYSERLLEMKAEALCMLRKHEEAITLCQESLELAEKNLTAKPHGLHVRQWRNRISTKCHFHLGRLEMALDLLEKQESENKTEESPDQLAVTIRELLNQKSSGNTAFHSGRHAEAVEHYTLAISNSMESRPFAAICFCNRAAAHQALSQIADAIADCSLAIALDENYVKAISRRATLHEMIRDYKQAAADLQRVVCLLEKQIKGKSKQSVSGNGKELRQVQQRLSTMEEEAKKEVPLDLYLILGIKKTDPASEIKKAYRKAALRHHPDKVAQALVRSDVGDEGRLWKDIAELVHKDSDRLFKMIGEAYAVLSDPAKREEYDHEEDMRKVLKESNNFRSSSRRYSDYYYSQDYPFERSSNRRYWQDTYRSYGSSHKRW